MNRVRISALDQSVEAAGFCCGQTALDDYIARYAAQDIRRNLARVFVATPVAEPHRLAGFFSLSLGRVNCADLPPLLAKKLPRYPVPVARIGRLAVSLDFQGQGLGAVLLADACQKVALASATLAVAVFALAGECGLLAAASGCVWRLMPPGWREASHSSRSWRDSYFW